MIIAEVCKYAPNYKGNFISSLECLEKYARQSNIQNEIIYVFPQGAEEKEWIKELKETHKVFFLPTGRIKENLTLLKLCRHHKIDIMHVHFYGIISTFLVGWFCKTKVINHFHNTLDNLNIAKAFILRLLSIPSKRFIGCSKAVYNTLIDNKFSKIKCSYITNCIDFSRFDTIFNDRPFPNNKNNLVILGTDFYRKGVDAALKSIEPIHTEYDLCLQIVTHNKQKTKELVEDVLGYSPDWVNYALTTEHIGDYYRNCVCFLSPSLAEGLCYAIPEALYCNCMVIKTNIPAMTYDLTGEEFITINSQEELQQRIEEVFNMDNNEKSLLIESLKEQVCKKYNINIWGKQVFALYEKVYYE